MSSAAEGPAVPARYRDRLRIEGLVLAACGLLGSAVLLAAVDEATEVPGSTIGQLALVAVLIAVFGPRLVRGWLARAEPVRSAEAGSGEPTPLAHVVAVAAVLTAAFGLLVGWDAGLRITGGCALVGLAQAFLLAPRVARYESARGVVVVRLPGSRLGRGTRLGELPAPVPPGT